MQSERQNKDFSVNKFSRTKPNFS